MPAPDPRSRGPHVDVSHATIVRKSLGCDRILLRLGEKNHRLTLIGDAFEHICHLLGDGEPQGSLIAWDDAAGGIQLFYARRDEKQAPRTRLAIFAGRHPDGQILGLSVEQMEIVEFGLRNSNSPEDFIAEEFLLSVKLSSQP
jgi:hypothetical protein